MNHSKVLLSEFVVKKKKKALKTGRLVNESTEPSLFDLDRDFAR